MSNHVVRSVLIPLLTLLSVLFFGELASSTMTVNAEKKLAPTATSQQPPEKTVEQVQKNIQVLKGMPESQLIPAMNFMASSLGVKCNFCHVINGNVRDFAADDKPEKNTARRMITMVQEVNKSTFKGATEVSCFTCHRGSTRVNGVPPLPLVVNASTPEDTPRPRPALPKIEDVLSRYMEALGGPAAIDKEKTRVMKGTYVLSTGEALPYEVYQVAPDKFHSVLTTPRSGVIERIFNGTSGWVKDSRGIHELEGGQLNDLKRYVDFFRDTKLAGQFSRLAIGGKDVIDGRDVYVVRGNRDSRRERLFFDAQTGLLVRRIAYLETMIGVIPEQTDYSDWREVDGVKVPFTVRVSSVDPSESATRKFTEIRINVPVEESNFSKP